MNPSLATIKNIEPIAIGNLRQGVMSRRPNSAEFAS